MLCAAEAASRGVGVILLEPNERLGRKLRITGKGRCNVTNACDARGVLANIPGDGRFLQSALHRFGPYEVMALFERLGVPLKVERGNRVFPVSDNAHDVADALARYVKASGAELMRARALDIETDAGGVSAVITDRGRIETRAACICTGGMSYPGTGSRGEGYELARRLGHSVTEPRPSLVPLTSPDAFCRELTGLTLKNVRLTAFEDGKSIYSEQGEMLFTHFGVSGPLVLSASAHMRGFGSSSYALELDLKPALDDARLDARMLRDLEKFHGREMKNALGELLPRAMIPVILGVAGVSGDTRVSELNRAQRRELLRCLKHFPIALSGTRPIAEAIVTSGGVPTREVEPRTMRSRLVPGLWFAGEILDLDAYTGGFNLQIAWSTGYVAGNSIGG